MVWLTQTAMVELFRSSKANISEHIKHIFKGRELDEKSVVRQFRTTAEEGKQYNFLYRRLAFCRQFYRAYPIVNALRSQFNRTP